MTEHKFTADEEVIKALKCCSSGECEKCKYVPQGDCYQGSLACNDDLMRSALDLINRQKSLLELSEKGLKLGINISENWEKAYRNAKAEAIKEFADRLCEGRVSNDPVVIAVNAELKMTEEKE